MTEAMVRRLPPCESFSSIALSAPADGFSPHA